MNGWMDGQIDIVMKIYSIDHFVNVKTIIMYINILY